jgi:hypothetical protein
MVEEALAASETCHDQKLQGKGSRYYIEYHTTS